MIDNVGAKQARKEIAKIKALVPNVHTAECERAIQTFGAMGLSPDTPLADSWKWGRALKFADGLDEVHLQSIARMEIKGRPYEPDHERSLPDALARRLKTAVGPI